MFSILRDVTERLQADAAARAVYEALADELASLRKRSIEVQQSAERLTTTVAHDLKAALHVVHGLIGLLHRHLDSGDVAQARANAQQIDQAARRMDTMVTWLARIAQVEQGELRRQRVDMRAMALSFCTQAVRAKPLPQIDFSVTELPGADADPELIAQVWQHLIDNAWKFARSEPGAKVLVDSFEQGGRTGYRVVDNGVGFDIAAATRLFIPFQRMHSSSDFAGLGIGLALAQRIVRRHGGELSLSSGFSSGTVAEFTLDASPADD